MAFDPEGSGEAALFALDTPWGIATEGSAKETREGMAESPISLPAER